MLKDSVYQEKLWELAQTDKFLIKNCKPYAQILKRVYFDCKKFATKDYNYIVEEDTFGEYKTLGEFFLKDEDYGVYQIHRVLLESKYQVDINNDDYILAFRFYDDRIEAYQVDKSLSYDSWTEIKELNKPKYQKRYLNAMYEMFGEEYKKHLEELKQSKEDGEQLEQ